MRQTPMIMDDDVFGVGVNPSSRNFTPPQHDYPHVPLPQKCTKERKWQKLTWE